MIDLFCGLGGGTEGALAEGYACLGFDIEQHVYGQHRYPGQLVLQDILTIHGKQLKDAAYIWASPPCQEYSYMAMPWSRGKQIAAALRGQGEFPAEYEGSRTVEELTALFRACFRIQREASEAAGHHIPMVVENVKGAQPWVREAKAHYGSFYLWGDIDTVNGNIVAEPRRGFDAEILRPPSRGGARGVKTAGHANIRDGHSHTRHLTNQRESDGIKAPGNDTFARDGQPCGKLTDPRYPSGGIKQHGSGPAWFDKALDERRKDATKCGGSWGSARVSTNP